MNTNKKGFVWMNEWTDLTADLTAEQLGNLLRAVHAHNLGEDYNLGKDKEVKMAFRFIAGALDRNNEKYEQICQKRAEAGKRGRAKQLGQMQANADNCGQLPANAGYPEPDRDRELDPEPEQKQDPEPHATLQGARAHEGEGFSPLETYGIMHNVRMAPAQHRHLCETYGTETTAAVIDELSCKLAEGTYNSDNHFATLTYWLGYRSRMGSGRVAMSSAQATPESREKELRELWERTPETEKREYIDRYGCKPWEREQQKQYEHGNE